MRVGPAQLTGLDSAQKGWADLGPTVLSASLGLGRMWPRHEGWARKEKKKEGGGNYFPPPILLHSFCMQEKLIQKMK